jgi:hypothetical protein
MKRTLVLTVVGVLVSGGVALAQDPDVGCGWGTKAFRGQTGVAPKVLAATTNGCFGNQTFGISSGTAGCKRSGAIQADARLNMFAGSNIDKLANDMAQGEGESLETLATLPNFGALFPSEQVTAGELLGSLSTIMSSDQQLAKYVS